MKSDLWLDHGSDFLLRFRAADSMHGSVQQCQAQQKVQKMGNKEADKIAVHSIDRQEKKQ